VNDPEPLHDVADAAKEAPARPARRVRRSLDPLASLQRALDAHESISYPTFLTPAFVLYEPDLIRHVLIDHAREYVRAAPMQETLGRFQQQAVGTETAFLREDEGWDQIREALQPAFLRRRMPEVGRFTTGAVVDMLAKWADRGADRVADGVELMTEMKAVVLRILVNVLFGIDLGDAATAAAEDLIAMERLQSSRTDVEAREALARSIRLSNSIVEAHERGDDLTGALSDYLRTSNVTTGQRQAEVAMLVSIGSDTTSVSLTWTWHLLGRNPELAARLEEEVDAQLPDREATVQDLRQLPYTRSVFQESMRLLPPAWIFSRRATREDHLGGRTIPEGATVCVSPYAMHRNSRYWKEPERFDPERFARTEVADRPGTVYIPFGAGPHRCIGEALATIEAPLVLATMARYCRLGPVSDEPIEPNPGWVLTPRGQVRMRPSFRRTPIAAGAGG
jgi:cytochrome P450